MVNWTYVGASCVEGGAAHAEKLKGLHKSLGVREDVFVEIISSINTVAELKPAGLVRHIGSHIAALVHGKGLLT